MPERRIALTLEFKSNHPQGTDLSDDALVDELVSEMVEHSNAINEDDGIAVESLGWEETAPPLDMLPNSVLMRATSFLNSHGLIAGTPVTLTRNVERYPSAFVNAGERGLVTVVDSTGAFPQVRVRLYSKFDGLAEWQNELHFYLNEENHVWELEGLRVAG